MSSRSASGRPSPCGKASCFWRRSAWDTQVSICRLFYMGKPGGGASAQIRCWHRGFVFHVYSKSSLSRLISCFGNAVLTSPFPQPAGSAARALVTRRMESAQAKAISAASSKTITNLGGDCFVMARGGETCVGSNHSTSVHETRHDL